MAHRVQYLLNQFEDDIARLVTQGKPLWFVHRFLQESGVRVSRGPVRTFVISKGLKFRGNKFGRRSDVQSTSVRADVMAVKYQAGMTLKQIGAEFGITRERVRQILKRHKGFDRWDGGQSVQARRSRERKRRVAEAAMLERNGCTLAEHKRVLDIGRQMMDSGQGIDKTPLGAFRRQKENANQRGIAWDMLFWDWWSIWQESGHWHERGRGQGYVMARIGDRGAYSPDNVFITTARQNASEANRANKRLPMGVSANESGRFSAHRQLNGQMHHLGTFDTPHEAHLAYLNFVPRVYRLNNPVSDFANVSESHDERVGASVATENFINTGNMT